MASWELSGSAEAIMSYAGLQSQGRTGPGRVRGCLTLEGFTHTTGRLMSFPWRATVNAVISGTGTSDWGQGCVSDDVFSTLLEVAPCH